MAVKAMLEYVKARYLSRYLGERGQGIVEYALILAFVVVIAAAITNSDDLKAKIQGVFTSIKDAFGNSGSTTPPAGT